MAPAGSSLVFVPMQFGATATMSQRGHGFPSPSGASSGQSPNLSRAGGKWRVPVAQCPGTSRVGRRSVTIERPEHRRSRSLLRSPPLMAAAAAATIRATSSRASRGPVVAKSPFSPLYRCTAVCCVLAAGRGVEHMLWVWPPRRGCLRACQSGCHATPRCSAKRLTQRCCPVVYPNLRTASAASGHMHSVVAPTRACSKRGR